MQGIIKAAGLAGLAAATVAAGWTFARPADASAAPQDRQVAVAAPASAAPASAAPDAAAATVDASGAAPAPQQPGRVAARQTDNAPAAAAPAEVTQAAAPGGGIEALRAFYDSVETLSADFTQLQVDANGEVFQRMSGRFLLARPEQFRWEYTKPYQQIIVSNGEIFSFYDVGLEQVTIRPIGNSLRTTPAQLLAGGAALEDAFEVVDGGRHDGLAWVRLTPLGKSSDFNQIRIGLDGNLPVAMQLDDKLGQTTRIRFDNITINQGIADQRFSLDIPEGVTVVDGRKGAPAR